ncbi:unknown protein [Seminavis robusta]|uniref:Uncharacterized protein n=1 Tax=Seminavis robusta TaxID=568900 RepID=A0A9N8HKA6_9STRA|nr:unknown protein [Seminavis robusta]|eukprot:Sro603_g173900.1 n/a (524) ;mRNA; f:14783-16451
MRQSRLQLYRLITIACVVGSVVAAVIQQVLKLQPQDSFCRKTAITLNSRPPWIKNLPLNPNATLANDVLAIHHDVYESRVIVTLQQNGRCPRPYLMGRLSGPALVKVENWTKIHAPIVSNETNMPVQLTATMEGTYRAPVGGQYFLEVVAIYCDDAFYDLKHRQDLFFQEKQPIELSQTNVSRKAVDWWGLQETREVMTFHFAPVCVENPYQHRLTANHATIWVDHETVKTQRALSEHTHSLRYTRHQPYTCMMAYRKKEALPPECVEPASHERYHDYKFQWNQHPKTNHRHDGRGPPIRIQSLSLPQPTVICFMGASHARFFKEAAERLNITRANNNLTIHWSEVPYPTDIQPGVVQRLIQIQRCNKLVIGVGQWPASYSTNPPMMVHAFYLHMKRALSLLVQFNLTQQVDVYTRNIHYNPLTHFISKCPPEGWRNPMVIDGYNAVIQQLCREMSPHISCLDTHFLTGAIWDGSPDWCHMGPRGAEEELLYVSAKILGLLPSRSDAETDAATNEKSLSLVNE